MLNKMFGIGVEIAAWWREWMVDVEFSGSADISFESLPPPPGW